MIQFDNAKYQAQQLAAGHAAAIKAARPEDRLALCRQLRSDLKRDLAAVRESYVAHLDKMHRAIIAHFNNELAAIVNAC